MASVPAFLFLSLASGCIAATPQLIRKASDFEDGQVASVVQSDGGVESYSVAKKKSHDQGGWLGKWNPVDGGDGRACRGADANDDESAYKMTIYGDSVVELESCKKYCLNTPACQGIEHNPFVKRCEVWTRPEGILATTPDEGTVCLSYVPGKWTPADGGVNRACRGETGDDDKDEYYQRIEGASVKNLDDCKRKCVNMFGCQGIQHNAEKGEGHCEVWTRPDGIQATQASDGYTCLKFEPDYDENMWPGKWTPVDGGLNRACRGKHSNDDDNGYYRKIVGSVVFSVDACKRLCVQTPNCRGIEHNPRGQCEIWTRGGGIQASKNVEGYSCIAYMPGKWWEVNGGTNRACRGRDSNDDKMEYKLQKFGDSVQTLDACKQICISVGGCKGIEHHASGRCEVWTELIGASVEAQGFTCLRYQSQPTPPTPLQLAPGSPVSPGFIPGQPGPSPGPPGRYVATDQEGKTSAGGGANVPSFPGQSGIPAQGGQVGQNGIPAAVGTTSPAPIITTTKNSTNATSVSTTAEEESGAQRPAMKTVSVLVALWVARISVV